CFANPITVGRAQVVTKSLCLSVNSCASPLLIPMTPMQYFPHEAMAPRASHESPLVFGPHAKCTPHRLERRVYERAQPPALFRPPVCLVPERLDVVSHSPDIRVRRLGAPRAGRPRLTAEKSVRFPPRIDPLPIRPMYRAPFADRTSSG